MRDMKTYMRERRHTRRKIAIELLGGECVDCTSQENLEFDHKDRDKKTDIIANMLSHSWENLKEELKLCVLRCRRCHEDRTVIQLYGGYADHGSYQKYFKGCKCRICMDGNRDRMRVYRAKKKNIQG